MHLLHWYRVVYEYYACVHYITHATVSVFRLGVLPVTTIIHFILCEGFRPYLDYKINYHKLLYILLIVLVMDFCLDADSLCHNIIMIIRVL